MLASLTQRREGQLNGDSKRSFQREERSHPGVKTGSGRNTWFKNKGSKGRRALEPPAMTPSDPPSPPGLRPWLSPPRAAPQCPPAPTSEDLRWNSTRWETTNQTIELHEEWHLRKSRPVFREWTTGLVGVGVERDEVYLKLGSFIDSTHITSYNNKIQSLYSFDNNFQNLNYPSQVYNPAQ